MPGALREALLDRLEARELWFDASDRAGVRSVSQLAQELGYTGALNGSAEMNTWLHKQVMTKLAESGGKVPDSIKKA